MTNNENELAKRLANLERLVLDDMYETANTLRERIDRLERYVVDMTVTDNALRRRVERVERFLKEWIENLKRL